MTTESQTRMALCTFTSLAQLEAAVGEPLGSSDWVTVTQTQVDQFAQVTGDANWIHTDVVRARTGPFSRTIAHGYLTLALIPDLASRVVSIQTPDAMINYGLNKVRFPAVVPVDSRVRLSAEIRSVEDVAAGKQVVWAYSIEVEGSAKPACVAETVMLLLPSAE